MEVIVAERGQITLPKPVRDALGLTKGMTLKVEVQGGRIILRKDVSEVIARVRGRFKAAHPQGAPDALVRQLRGHDAGPDTQRGQP